ncbi:UDP-glucuronosyltransferase 1A1-like isoform X1 [Sardina pilchardus]|uniref:UDP-glucuronosyltransferase 1A1-like isoform X1 n=1 Tax=Sardina pilchardus TaxID=27697 RepID=UPI002E146AA3
MCSGRVSLLLLLLLLAAPPLARALDSAPESPVQPEREPRTPESPVQPEREPRTPESPVQQEREPRTPESPVQQEEEARTPEDPVQPEEQPRTPEDPIQQEEQPSASEDPIQLEEEPRAPEDPIQPEGEVRTLEAEVRTLEAEVRTPGKLLVVPMDGSHWVGLKVVAEEMARRGHSVLVVIPEVSMRLGPGEGYETLTYPVPYGHDLVDKLLADNAQGLQNNTGPLLDKISKFWARVKRMKSFMVTTSESLLLNEELVAFLRAQEFDALLTDPMVPTGAILAHNFSVPSVYLLRGIPCGLDLEAMACPSPPSYVPRYFSSNTDQMSFVRRVVNFLVAMAEPALCKVIYWEFDGVASRFMDKDVTIAEILSSASLWLLRYDFTMELPRPLMPNMVLIGGINCAVKRPLTQELKEFVEGSGEHGIVVFTLGSLVESMPAEKAAIFFSAFSQIPQRVLWRYSGPLPDHVPENVKVMKWLPQNDLLAHPKAKAFITHGGTHGIYEGICNGVPMVMMPLFGDQTDNAHRVAHRGVAVVLSIFDVTPESLVDALDTVINVSSYQENMQKLSAIHNDRPIEPLDLAVHWTEFVMRHKGAEHLRPAAHHLNWIQYHSLDVIGFLLVVVATVVVVMITCCAACLRRCCGGSKKTKKE